MTSEPKKKTHDNNHPDIEGVITPDGYKSQTLDIVLPKRRLETGPAARFMAPPDYEFSPDNSSLQIITARDGGNNVVSQVIQIDNKHFRVLWSRGQKETADINEQRKSELQAALDWQLERIKPEINDDGSANSITRIGIFFNILGVLIDKGFFPKRLTVDTFIESGISFLYGKENIHKWIAEWFQFIGEAQLSPTVRVSHPLENIKNYIRIGEQMEIFQEKTRPEVEKYNITESGLDLDEDEEDALLGIQTLFSDNEYRPNYNKNGIEALYFTMPDLCRACCMTMRTDKRGRREFDRKERMRLVKAINKLETRRRLFQFEVPDPTNKKKIKGIEFVKPLFSLIKFYNKDMDGKKKIITGYAITDYKDTLGRDIDERFLLLPRGLNQDIKRIVGRKYTIYHRRFFSFLFTQANNRRYAEHESNTPADWNFEINEKLLVESRLKMTTFIKNRQWDRINERLASIFFTAKELGYAVDITAGTNKLGERKFIIQLNREKFTTLKNWGLKDANQLTGKLAADSKK